MQHVMLYCFKKGDSTNDITDEIYTVYGNDATITIIHNWFKRFRDGNFNSKDENRSSCPATTKMDFIKAILAENPRYSVQEIVNAINISRKTKTKLSEAIMMRPRQCKTTCCNDCKRKAVMD
ncbi:hypothetical protein HZU73_07764 [Apis mellifera caucasica]|uniref:Uncharacterized protein LOC113219204 n=1 Tax=Apis mellifera TaxID=7460 RepID=A0A7M7MT43_APIME|nr:uncharacterized protein LOC113219204 [Apis mellifera]KAG6796917.1 hypothetical protein HZU73_07764 [Apis mellifera caucasica]|eukprot:XP_026300570.1 uncharacterized protein LOC113219204 [Apis mellifera]